MYLSNLLNNKIFYKWLRHNVDNISIGLVVIFYFFACHSMHSLFSAIIVLISFFSVSHITKGLDSLFDDYITNMFINVAIKLAARIVVLVTIKHLFLLLVI